MTAGSAGAVSALADAAAARAGAGGFVIGAFSAVSPER
jgi:hypothetical protein